MKITFRFLTAIVFVFCLFVFSARAGTASPTFDNSGVKEVKILIVGTPSIGLTALAEKIAATGLPVVIVQDVGDCDGLTARAPEMPLIESRRIILPMATVEQTKAAIQPKMETPKRVSPHSRNSFVYLPPDIAGYNGMSFANPIRAQP